MYLTLKYISTDPDTSALTGWASRQVSADIEEGKEV